MRHLLRRHPIAVGVGLLILSPYIAAIALLVVIAFLVALLLDLISGR